MTLLFILSVYVFGFLAFVLAVLLGVSFTQSQRNRYPILRALDGKQLVLVLLAVTFAALSYGANAIKDTWEAEPIIVIHVGEQEVLKATQSRFEREVKDAADERRHAAIGYFEAAQADFDKGLYRDAAENYQKSIDAIPTMAAYLNLGTSLHIMSGNDSARKAFASGLRIAQVKNATAYKAAFLYQTGNLSCDAGQFDEGMAFYEEALTLFEKLEHQGGRIATLTGMGCAYLSRGNLEKAFRAHKDALEASKRSGDLKVQSGTLNNMGLVLADKGELDAALRLYRRSLVLSQQLGDARGEAGALNNMGTVNREQGDLDLALNRHEAALQMYAEAGDIEGQASALNNAGIVYRLKGEFEKALEAHKAALKMDQEIGNALAEANALGSIGVDYALMGKRTLALENLRAARKMFLKMGIRTRNLAMVEAAIRDLSQKENEE